MSMKLLGKRRLTAECAPYWADPQEISLRIGGQHWLMDHQEAIALAVAIVAAVDESKALPDRADGTQ
jgi:hypothetical protein